MPITDQGNLSPSVFAATYPSYEATRAIDELRAREYAFLDVQGHTYVDYTAASLYATSQLDRHMAVLRDRAFGNPHSTNPSSAMTMGFVARARSEVLRFFNASPDEWSVVFTGNASQALKLVGESYPFGPGDQYLLTFDNHNSVNGIREFARSRGATATYIPIVLPEMRIEEADLAIQLERARPRGNNLFAYPAQSNFSGVQHPLEWIDRARAKGWDVLLDAAAFTLTNRLDLGRWHPDFVVQSFYKIFGYPTGVGCPLARKTALAVAASVVCGGRLRWRRCRATSISSPRRIGVRGRTLTFWRCRPWRSVFGTSRRSADTIHERTRCLTGWLLDNLRALRQTNGQPLVRLYGPLSTDMRGSTVTFNFYRANGRAIDHRIVEERANAAKISLRTGCFCNPGGGEIALGITGTELSSCFRQPEHQDHMTIDDFRLCIDGKSTGAVRVSLGLVSNLADVNRVIGFVQQFVGV